MASRTKTVSIKKRRRVRSIAYFDYGLLAIVMLLFAFGLVMLYSTSAYMATLEYEDSLHYLKRQLLASALGFAGIVGLNITGYRWLKRFSGLFYFGAFILCVLVIFIGTAQGSSSRWIYFGPLSFQPSEFAKLAVIIYLAALVADSAKSLRDWHNVVRAFFHIVPLLIPVAYNNLSTAVIIAGIAFGMLFVASPDYRAFIVIMAIGAIGIVFFISGVGYRSDRIDVWLHPEKYEKGFQTLQGLYAIGSGGLFGKGLGESMQKLGYVPEAQNDMIFSIVCEELGIFGAICVILMYLLLLWRFMIIAYNARDMFGSYLVIGIMIHISLQVILNIAVVTNTLPNTGVTLPFISYGGTSVMFLLFEMGVAMAVSRGIRLE
ncbi:MAG: cell division protein FtsW [Lachnospiraceae bacterium]|nr:cell division protein FtsW [Lachnospiraceae bacterium]